MQNDPAGLGRPRARATALVRIWSWIRIGAIDHSKTRLSHNSHDADGSQESRGIINKKKKRCDASGAKTGSNKCHKLENMRLDSVNRADGKKQSENEQAGCASDEIVAHQYGCNNPRRHLTA